MIIINTIYSNLIAFFYFKFVLKIKNLYLKVVVIMISAATKAVIMKVFRP